VQVPSKPGDNIANAASTETINQRPPTPQPFPSHSEAISSGRWLAQTGRAPLVREASVQPEYAYRGGNLEVLGVVFFAFPCLLFMAVMGVWILIGADSLNLCGIQLQGLAARALYMAASVFILAMVWSGTLRCWHIIRSRNQRLCFTDHAIVYRPGPATPQHGFLFRLGAATPEEVIEYADIVELGLVPSLVSKKWDRSGYLMIAHSRGTAAIPRNKLRDAEFYEICVYLLERCVLRDAEPSLSKIREVQCEECATEFVYQLGAVTRRQVNQIFIENCIRAKPRSYEELCDVLQRICDPVPCPCCWCYQPHMVQRAKYMWRRGLLRSAPYLLPIGAMLLVCGGIAGAFGTGQKAIADNATLATGCMIASLVPGGVAFLLVAVLPVAKHISSWRHDPNALEEETRKRLGRAQTISKAAYLDGERVPFRD
jgi:hypothetical protein